MHRTIAILAFTAAICSAGCNQSGKVKADYATIKASGDRDPAAAKEHTATATKLIEDGKLDEAQKELQAAMAADLFHGPAHNNLGGVYLRQKKYYLAAWEFQYAAKLMPSKAQPRNNLGMVFETVGRLDEAMQWYDKALALAPETVEIAANLARIHTRKNIKTEQTRQLLAMVVMKDQRSDWVQWAQDRLAIIGQPKAPLPPVDKSEPTTQPARQE
jgi:Tfp pilus assembly protein PilF